MRRRRTGAALGLALALATALPATAVPAARPAADAAEVRRRVERILAVPGYQTELPETAEAEPPFEPPRWGPLARVVGWVVLIAAAAGAVLVLGYVLWDLVARRGARRAAPQPPPPRPPPAVAAAAAAGLPDADSLAAAGRFGEAVHALLLHALAGLARRRGAPLPPSLTGREAIPASGLAGEPRGALAELVAAVERFLFAGRALDAGDWERCRAAYARLAGSGG